ncbi:MAG: MATE family efflux transporter [Planctomycetia bacterium]|nr:MATE family efflux transporter [Planctomycetia bacterium]
MFSINFLKNWWSRPAGAKEIILVALPMIISSASFALMQFADRVFLTWFDTRAMGASFSAGMFIWVFVAFPFSIAGYANAFVSQYNGAKEYHKIGKIVWQGILLGFVAMPIVLAFSPFFQSIFLFFRHSEEMSILETTYLYYSVWGIGPMIANEALVAFFCGRKKMRIVMTVNLLAVFLNIVLDYYLIFGINGYFRWGVAGAAIATSISQWVRFFCFFASIIWESRQKDFYGFWSGFGFHRQPMTQLLRFGGMGSIQFVIDMVQSSIFIQFIGMVGEKENAASAIAFNLNSLSFMPIIGAGVAVVTLVGNYLGENRPYLARRAAISAMEIATFLSGFFVLLFVFYPDLLLTAYTKQNPEAFEPLREMTITLLRFVAAYIFFDTINIIFCSAIKGAGDTRFIMLVTLIMSPFLVFPTIIGVQYYHFGVYWCWLVLTVWICIFSIIHGFRFFQGKWMLMRLNDPQPISND